MTTQHRYIPMTEQDQLEMLETIGVSSLEELFRDIPASIRYEGTLPMSGALDESGAAAPSQGAGCAQCRSRVNGELPGSRPL